MCRSHVYWRQISSRKRVSRVTCPNCGYFPKVVAEQPPARPLDDGEAVVGSPRPSQSTDQVKPIDPPRPIFLLKTRATFGTGEMLCVFRDATRKHVTPGEAERIIYRKGQKVLIWDQYRPLVTGTLVEDLSEAGDIPGDPSIREDIFFDLALMQRAAEQFKAHGDVALQKSGRDIEKMIAALTYSLEKSKVFRTIGGDMEELPTRIDPAFNNESLAKGTVSFRGSRYTEFRYLVEAGILVDFEFFERHHYVRLQRGRIESGVVKRGPAFSPSTALYAASKDFDPRVLDQALQILDAIEDAEVQEVARQLKAHASR